MPETPIADQIAALLHVEFHPLLEPAEVQGLHRALPGYQVVADDAARFAQRHEELLQLGPARAALEESLAEVTQLEPVEHLLERLYLSIYHRRLQATSRCMEGLYDTARRIRDFAEAYPSLEEEGQALLDFMKAFKPGRKKDKKEEGAGGA